MRLIVDCVFWGTMICGFAVFLMAFGIPLIVSLPILLVIGAYLNSNGKLW
jgi:hypothetical protein